MIVNEEIRSLDDLRPGDIGFGPIGGRVGLGVRIALAIADGGGPYQHVYMVTEGCVKSYESPGFSLDEYSGPWAVEAMPRGAVKVDISSRWTKDFCYIRPDYLDETQALQAASIAEGLIGTPYSYLDYLALAAHHMHLPVSHLDKFITTSKHMICSQLVDYCLTQANWHTFNDHRLSQDVTPSAFYNELTRRRPGLTTTYPI